MFLRCYPANKMLQTNVFWMLRATLSRFPCLKLRGKHNSKVVVFQVISYNINIMEIRETICKLKAKKEQCSSVMSNQ